MVNLNVDFPIKRRPIKFMNVMMLEHCTFDHESIGCEGVYHTKSTVISKISFPIVGVKMSLLANLYVGFLSYTFQFLIEVALHIITFIFCLGRLCKEYSYRYK
jgi:hypothetical protein